MLRSIMFSIETEVLNVTITIYFMKDYRLLNFHILDEVQQMLMHEAPAADNQSPWIEDLGYNSMYSKNW